MAHVINQDKCAGCGSCAEACPTECIVEKAPAFEGEAMAGDAVVSLSGETLCAVVSTASAVVSAV